ncbi:GH13523 [Drosophila grimshawi]|uniref:GH13523 n=1 Tax=Drosophila grimshawi TaxID=7222 RepID=B4JPI1_DROGR|nr:GH13523 [Drosophila grimshawi]
MSKIPGPVSQCPIGIAGVPMSVYMYGRHVAKWDEDKDQDEDDDEDEDEDEDVYADEDEKEQMKTGSSRSTHRSYDVDVLGLLTGQAPSRCRVPQH